MVDTCGQCCASYTISIAKDIGNMLLKNRSILTLPCISSKFVISYRIFAVKFPENLILQNTK